MPFVDGRTIPEALMRPGINGRFLAHKDLGASTVRVALGELIRGQGSRQLSNGSRGAVSPTHN